MRSILWCWIAGVFLIGCARNPQAAAPDPQLTKRQTIKVYFKLEGADRDVTRFQRFVDIALDDQGMTREVSAAKADAIVYVQLKEKEEQQSVVYVPVSFITFAAPKHEEYTLRSCNSVSNRKEAEPFTYVDAIKLPADWKKAFPKLTVYIDESKVKGSEELIKALKARLAEAHYAVARSKSGADAEVTSVKVQTLSVPMRTMDRARHYEIRERPSDKPYSTMNGTDTTWLGPNTSINLNNFPCGQAIATFGETGFVDSFWSDANSITKAIQKHITKNEPSN